MQYSGKFLWGLQFCIYRELAPTRKNFLSFDFAYLRIVLAICGWLSPSLEWFDPCSIFTVTNCGGQHEWNFLPPYGRTMEQCLDSVPDTGLSCLRGETLNRQENISTGHEQLFSRPPAPPLQMNPDVYSARFGTGAFTDCSTPHIPIYTWLTSRHSLHTELHTFCSSCHPCMPGQVAKVEREVHTNVNL